GQQNLRCAGQAFGLENLALIPGNAGAAPIQNIGAYGVELKDRFHSLSAIDLSSGEQVDMSAEDCVFGYRDSIFKQSLAGRYLITAIRLVLSKSPDLRLDYPALQSALAGISRDEITPRTVADTVIGIRRSKLPDPTQTPNAGSFFKNPVVNEDVAADLRRRFPGLVSYPAENGKAKLAAGWLLENAGWKGHREGHVGMHDRQALVLVNHGGASQRELLGMVSSIQADIVSKFGIELEVEPQVVTAGTF
ncbi:MAG: UDP-N-acetylmuramate dehydrogenase, partial [bacterium]